VVWTNQPTFTTTNEVTIPQSAGSTDNYPNLPVTSLVQDIWNNPTTSYGFMIMLQTEVQFRSLKFASSDNVDSTRHPELEVCYSVILESAAEEQSGKPWMEIYPNPASEQVTIEAGYEDSEESQIKLWNMNGQMIYSEPFTTDKGRFLSTWDLTKIPAGVYFVEVGALRKIFVKD
jgi:hypothetical protein